MKFRRLIIGVIALLLAVGACKPPTVPSTVGQPLPAAIQILEKARFKKITVVDTHGATIAKSKYNDGYLVSAQDPAGTKGYPSSTKIKLTVSETKPTPPPLLLQPQLPHRLPPRLPLPRQPQHLLPPQHLPQLPLPNLKLHPLPHRHQNLNLSRKKTVRKPKRQPKSPVLSTTATALRLGMLELHLFTVVSPVTEAN